MEDAGMLEERHWEDADHWRREAFGGTPRILGMYWKGHWDIDGRRAQGESRVRTRRLRKTAEKRVWRGGRGWWRM